MADMFDGAVGDPRRDEASRLLHAVLEVTGPVEVPEEMLHFQSDEMVVTRRDVDRLVTIVKLEGDDPGAATRLRCVDPSCRVRSDSVTELAAHVQQAHGLSVFGCARCGAVAPATIKSPLKESGGRFDGIEL